jgi:DnaJ-class molecular chaperone
MAPADVIASLRPGDRVFTLIDFDHQNGRIRKGDAGIVNTLGCPQPDRISADFPNFPRLCIHVTEFRLEVADDARTCPAHGGPGCGEADAVEDADQRCVGWRQTGGCTPGGPREPAGDKPCGVEIPADSSGFCECGGGRHAREASCGHQTFTCDAECRRVRRYTCVGWRRTGGCSADGHREPAGDLPCDRLVDPSMSGFCECGDGRLVRKAGCEHGTLTTEPFTCREECRKESDFYEDMGIDTSADEQVVKQAWRRLSKRYHPDKTRNDATAGARFAVAREAYDILVDPVMRAVYDSAGLAALEEARRNKLEKGGDAQASVEVDLDQLYNGAEINAKAQRKVICRGCADSQSKRCKLCREPCANEIGFVNVQFGHMIMKQQREVPSKERCRNEDVTLTLQLERGMRDGDTLTFKGKGEQKPKKIPGDYVLTLRQRKHAVFRRSGLDLHTDMNISLKEALLGFERSIRHMDGRDVFISYTGVTKPGATIRVDGEGMPQRGDSTADWGSLFVSFTVVMPEEGQLKPEMRNWLNMRLPDLPSQ